MTAELRSDGPYPQHRGVVAAQHGMVASAHPLASRVGIQVLAEGGNAMDAALAMAGMTAVALPDQCGIGGDAFLLVYRAATRKVAAICGSGPAPLAADPQWFLEQGFTRMPLQGIAAIAVPGAVAAYRAGYRLMASRSWAELWAPAIAYAQQGIPVLELTASHIRNERAKILAEPALAVRFYPGGRPLGFADRLVQPELAASLEEVAATEGEAFYRGSLGERLVNALRRRGSLLAGPEWQAFTVGLETPLQTEYRGLRVCTQPLPAAGAVLLESLNLVEPWPLREWGYLAADTVHVQVEAKKLAFADRLRYLGDPAMVRSPVDLLISKAYAVQRSQMVSLDRCGEVGLAGDLTTVGGDTTLVLAVDRDGNAVALIHSLGHAFGSGVVAGDTGVLLNNRAGRGFSLAPGPNQIAPGKRTMHTLSTWMAFAGDRLRWVGGTPGGDGQPQWNLQILSYLIDSDLNVQQAVEAPRWLHVPGTDSDLVDAPPALRVESRFDGAVVAELARRGHPVETVGPWAGGGGAQLIEVDPSGTLLGGSDPRVDGCALGY